MTWFMLFGLYLIKHATMAHIVDVGYSQSRLQGRNWWKSLVFYAGCEIVVSALAFHQYSGSRVGPLLLLEFLGLVLAASYERRAFIHELFKRHAIAEFSMVLLYMFMAFQLSTQ